ncbi:MAG: hypothetical protein O7G32_08435 [SAR324 cluster bacterium]|nr:hypothetical protein [SAR324 cluster bacterium]
MAGPSCREQTGGHALHIRLILIALVLVLAVYLLRRIARAVARDPRLRQMLSNFSFQMLRIFLLRNALGMLLRAVRFLRFFR